MSDTYLRRYKKNSLVDGTIVHREVFECREGKDNRLSFYRRPKENQYSLEDFAKEYTLPSGTIPGVLEICPPAFEDAALGPPVDSATSEGKAYDKYHCDTSCLDEEEQLNLAATVGAHLESLKCCSNLPAVKNRKAKQ